MMMAKRNCKLITATSAHASLGISSQQVVNLHTKLSTYTAWESSHPLKMFLVASALGSVAFWLYAFRYEHFLSLIGVTY